MSVTLYALDGCPYCEQVMDTLDTHDVAYETVWVDSDFSERGVVKEVSEQRGVPVLEDEARSVVMTNAENITEYVETTLA